jgi:hypothetical protein
MRSVSAVARCGAPADSAAARPDEFSAPEKAAHQIGEGGSQVSGARARQALSGVDRGQRSAREYLHADSHTHLLTSRSNLKRNPKTEQFT